MSDTVEIDTDLLYEGREEPFVPGFTCEPRLSECDTNLALDVPARWRSRGCCWCRWSPRDEHPEYEFQIRELCQHWACNTHYHFLRPAQPWKQELRACWYHFPPYCDRFAQPNMESDKSITLATTLPPPLVDEANNDFRIAGNQISNEERPISQRITDARARMHTVAPEFRRALILAFDAAQSPGHAYPHLRSYRAHAAVNITNGRWSHNQNCAPECNTNLALDVPARGRRHGCCWCRWSPPDEHPDYEFQSWDLWQHWACNTHYHSFRPAQPRREELRACRHHFPLYQNLVPETGMKTEQRNSLEEDLPPPPVDESDNDFDAGIQTASEDWQIAQRNIDTWMHAFTAALRGTRIRTFDEAQSPGHAHPHSHQGLSATASTIGKLGG